MVSDGNVFETSYVLLASRVCDTPLLCGNTPSKTERILLPKHN